MIFLFAHGAGASSRSDWMRGWAERLRPLGAVRPFDYPYMAAGRKAPDRLPKLLAAHREQLDAARDAHPGEPIVLIGKSMGSRVGCHLANEPDVDVAAVVCLGYPLEAMSKTGRVRDEVLLALDTPTLFVEGTRDPMCPLPLLEDVRARMSAPSSLHVVETGNHALTITKGHTRATGRSQADSDAAALDAIRTFLTAVFG